MTASLDLKFQSSQHGVSTVDHYISKNFCGMYTKWCHPSRKGSMLSSTLTSSSTFRIINHLSHNGYSWFIIYCFKKPDSQVSSASDHKHEKRVPSKHSFSIRNTRKIASLMQHSCKDTSLEIIFPNVTIKQYSMNTKPLSCVDHKIVPRPLTYNHLTFDLSIINTDDPA